MKSSKWISWTVVAVLVVAAAVFGWDRWSRDSEIADPATGVTSGEAAEADADGTGAIAEETYGTAGAEFAGAAAVPAGLSEPPETGELAGNLPEAPSLDGFAPRSIPGGGGVSVASDAVPVGEFNGLGSSSGGRPGVDAGTGTFDVPRDDSPPVASFEPPTTLTRPTVPDAGRSFDLTRTPPPVEPPVEPPVADRSAVTFGEKTARAPVFERDLSPPARLELPGTPSRNAPIRPAAGIGTPAGTRVHVVEPGDNYWSISRRHYGTARYFNALAEHNRERFPDPRKMRPGMKVLVPDRSLLEARFAGLVPKPSADQPTTDGPQGFFVDVDGHPRYRIDSEDTLAGIAGQVLGRRSRWIQIFQMNRDRLQNPDKLKPGSILRLPADAARVELVPSSGDGR